MSPHAVFFIDYLGGITLIVHVRTCNISVSWRLDNVNTVDKGQITSFTWEWRIASFTFSLLEIFVFYFEADLDLRWYVADSLSVVLPPFGAISLSRRLLSFNARFFYLL